MNPYFTDLVDIVSVSHDENGALTEVVTSSVPARVSERNKLVIDKDGKEVKGSLQVMLASTASVTYDSKVVIRRIGGATYAMPTKQWQIKSISTGHMFIATHIEVWV
jgi:hypothetical protein